MKFFQQVQLIFIRNLKKRLRQPIWFVLAMMQPMLYLLLYMPLLKNLGDTQALPLGQIAQIFVPGMLVIMGVSCLFAGFGFVPELRGGYITRLLVTPINRFALILAYVLEQSFSLLAQAILLLTVAFFLGLNVAILGILLALVLIILIGITMTAFSLVISIVTKSEDGVASMVNTLYLPIMLLSGIMLPISLAPDWLKTAAHFNPFYYAVEAARALFAGNFTESIIWQGFLIMGAFAAFSLWLAVKKLRTMAA